MLLSVTVLHRLICSADPQPTLMVLNVVYFISNSTGVIYYEIVLHLTGGVKGRSSVDDYEQCQRMPDLFVCLEEMSINMANSLKVRISFQFFFQLI